MTKTSTEQFKQDAVRLVETSGTPKAEAARKLLWMVHRDIVKKWTMPIPNWTIILNQLAIYFHNRFPI